MAIALFDTNILIDISKGIPAALTEIGYYSSGAISIISYMEFVVGLRRDLACGEISQVQFEALKDFADSFLVVQLTPDIVARAIRIRSNSLRTPPKLKLPDAIIYASAEVTGRSMVTRDPGGFVGSMVRIPYRLDNGAAIDISPPPL